MELPPNKYIGTTCQKCSSNIKYVVTQKCVQCREIYNQKYYKTNAQKQCAYQAEYRRTHSYKVAVLKKKWSDSHQDNARRSKRKYKGWAPGEHERAEALRPFVVECACCKSKDPRTKLGWFADHDHQTGKFRSWICHPCNIVIGFVEKFGRTPDNLVLTYLESHQS